MRRFELSAVFRAVQEMTWSQRRELMQRLKAAQAAKETQAIVEERMQALRRRCWPWPLASEMHPYSTRIEPWFDCVVGAELPAQRPMSRPLQRERLRGLRVALPVGHLVPVRSLDDRVQSHVEVRAEPARHPCRKLGCCSPAAKNSSAALAVDRGLDLVLWPAAGAPVRLRGSRPTRNPMRFRPSAARFGHVGWLFKGFRFSTAQLVGTCPWNP
jgi:hypothetical protein